MIRKSVIIVNVKQPYFFFKYCCVIKYFFVKKSNNNKSAIIIRVKKVEILFYSSTMFTTEILIRICKRLTFRDFQNFLNFEKDLYFPFKGHFLSNIFGIKHLNIEHIQVLLLVLYFFQGIIFMTQKYFS